MNDRLIFDRQKLIARRNKAVDYCKAFKHFKHIADDTIERISLIDNKFEFALDLGCRNGEFTKSFKQQYPESKVISTDISLEMLKSFDHDFKHQVDEENVITNLESCDLSIRENHFDLIHFSLGLHWINNIQSFLKQINYLLKPNGVFIANFIGGGSLKKLRDELVAVETRFNHPHHPHVAPFIYFHHVSPLLQQAGFNDIIVDYHTIKLSYPTAYALMYEIKNIGESSILCDTSHYSISKNMIKALADSSTQFNDSINLINFIASKNKNSIKLKTRCLDA